MFERFNDEARDVLAAAQQEARRLRCPAMGVEHLLIAMAAGSGRGSDVLRSHAVTAEALRTRLNELDGDALDSDALATLGIDLERVREATEAHLGPGALDPRPGPVRSGHVPFSKPAKKVLELAVREAIRFGSREINSVYLLLGLMREIDTGGRRQPAARMLAAEGIELAPIRREAERLVTDRAA